MINTVFNTVFNTNLLTILCKSVSLSGRPVEQFTGTFYYFSRNDSTASLWN